MSEDNTIHEFCQRIEGESQGQIGDIIRRAEEERKNLIDKAKKEAQGAKEKIISQARLESQKKEKDILSALRLKESQMLLEAQEGIIQKAFERLKVRLDALRKSKEYSRIIEDFIKEAALTLNSDKLLILVSAQDAGIFSSGYLAGIKEDLSKRINKPISLEVKKDPHINDGGVIISAASGRVIFDNTFSARLKRLKEELRRIIWKELFEKND